MQARQQTIEFVMALLKHCAAVQITVLRYVGTEREHMLNRPHTVRTPGDLDRLLPWLWYENTNCAAQVYVRPDPTQPHPWLFFDDISRAQAERIADKYAMLVVETSAGSCQIRLLADRHLDTPARTAIQRDLAARVGADPGSISGDKWGRLPGYRNRKPGRGGCWTNFVLDTTAIVQRYSPAPIAAPAAIPTPPGGAGRVVVSAAPMALDPTRGIATATGRGACGDDIREFAYACHMLRSGYSHDDIARCIAARALARGKRESEAAALAYAQRTVAAAAARLR